MRTSPRNRQRRRASGFTLIEMMVTMVIIAMLAGLASLSIGGRAHRQARDEAERLAQVLDFATEEATLQAEELGIDVEEEGYSVLRFDAESEAWAKASEEKQFAAHTLPGGVSMELEIGERTELRRGDGPRGGAEELLPEVLVLSSGEITPFEIAFSSTDSTEPAARIVSDGSGTLRFE